MDIKLMMMMVYGGVFTLGDDDPYSWSWFICWFISEIIVLIKARQIIIEMSISDRFGMTKYKSIPQLDIEWQFLFYQWFVWTKNLSYLLKILPILSK